MSFSMVAICYWTWPSSLSFLWSGTSTGDHASSLLTVISYFSQVDDDASGVSSLRSLLPQVSPPSGVCLEQVLEIMPLHSSLSSHNLVKLMMMLHQVSPPSGVSSLRSLLPQVSGASTGDHASSRLSVISFFSQVDDYFPSTSYFVYASLATNIF